MQSPDDPASRILEIEARQDEVLQLLAELEQRIAQVLAESLVDSSRQTIAVSVQHFALRAA